MIAASTRMLIASMFLSIIPIALAADSIVLEPVGDIAQDTKAEIKFTLKAKSADGPVQFAVAKARKDGQLMPVPKNLTLDKQTGALDWTPTPSQAGNYELTVSAKDAKDAEAFETVKISVRERPICAGGGPVADLLRKWHAEKTAAGNTGDFYDNRDRDHSALGLSPFPQVDIITYTPEQRKTNQDWAAASLLHKAVVFGNSSTSAGVLNGGSNVRLYYMHPRGPGFLYEEYRANNIYMYPAHHDHHPGRNGKPFYGDVYPANTPYLITSHGSSGSDQPFMHAVPYTLAAFRPEVKKKLIETGLVMPTVQMILRSSNKHLTEPKEYLTGRAHPPVFQGSWVNDLKMIQTAHDIKLDTIPPMIQLKVLEEDTPVDGKDYFEGGRTEKLFDTPASIARIVRGTNHVRKMVVSAEESFDVNKRPLKFEWIVLRGDSKRVVIKPKNEAGSVVEIAVTYHDRFTVDDGVKLETNRVDIGAFVHNGSYHSAPGFVTLFTLDNEGRTYDDKGQLLEIGYSMGETELHVTDWNALFEALKPETDTSFAKLLRKSFKAEELTGLAKVADEYKTASSNLKTAQDNSKQKNETRQKLQTALKPLVDKTATAKKAHEAEPNDDTLTAWKKASLERDAADEVYKQADMEVQAVQKTLSAAQKVVDDLLNQKQAGLEMPAKALVDRGLNHLKDNPNFYSENADEISAISKAKPGLKARIDAARKRLTSAGVLKDDADKFVLEPLRKGDSTLSERLTSYEKAQIERFNAEILSSVMAPKHLRTEYKVNFVDQRLFTPKTWRDVYHYDLQGAITGWTRHDGDKPVEFNAAGQLVLEKDEKGRALKARTVRYEVDGMNRQGGERKLKYVPGDKVVHYEYADADDFKGKSVKEESIEDKK